MTNKLKYMAARIGLGIAHADEIKSLVNDLLDNEVYSDDFIDILDSNPTRMNEVVAPLTSYLNSIGIRIPNSEQAVWDLIAYHALAIAEGKIDPLKGLNSMIRDVYWNYDFSNSTREYLGDSHGIEQLIGYYWGYEDLVERPTEVSGNGQYGDDAIVELKKEIKREALQWTELYGSRA